MFGDSKISDGNYFAVAVKCYNILNKYVTYSY